MHIDLSRKSALVTASTAGIGLAIAKGLAASGAHGIINGRNDASLGRGFQALRDAVPEAQADGAAADLSDADGVEALIDGLGGRTIDILINNAGIYGPQDFFETDDATWERYWQMNVMSGVRLSRALMPAMVQRGWGRVVFISSESVRNIPADMIHYGVTKTAQLAVSRGLAKRVAGSCHRQCCIARPHALRRLHRDAAGRDHAHRQVIGRSRTRFRYEPPAQLCHPAPGDTRGSCQPRRLRRLAASLGHLRGCPTR